MAFLDMVRSEWTCFRTRLISRAYWCFASGFFFFLSPSGRGVEPSLGGRPGPRFLVTPPSLAGMSSLGLDFDVFDGILVRIGSIVGDTLRAAVSSVLI